MERGGVEGINEKHSPHEMYNVDETLLLIKLMLNWHWHSDVNHKQAAEVHETGLLCWCVKIWMIDYW